MEEKWINLVIGPDGKATTVKDKYTVTICCDSEEEQERCIQQLMGLNWVPVSERLPENDEYVLITCQTQKGRKSVFRAYWDGKHWVGSGSMSTVTAWKPMPEPYSEERDTE